VRGVRFTYRFIIHVFEGKLAYLSFHWNESSNLSWPPSKSALLSIFGGVFEKTRLKKFAFEVFMSFWNMVYFSVFNEVDDVYVVKEEFYQNIILFGITSMTQRIFLSNRGIPIESLPCSSSLSLYLLMWSWVRLINSFSLSIILAFPLMITAFSPL